MDKPPNPAPETLGPSIYEPIRAPRGSSISCKGWPQEAALRLLMNSVDRDVAEMPELLTPFAALGRVASDWTSFRAIAESLRALENDTTLFVQNGQPTGVVSTSADSPRVLIVDSDPAASWLNVGPQLFLPELYETLDAAKRRHFNGYLAGKLIAAKDTGFASAAVSLAAMMHGGAFLGIDADSERIKSYVKTGYCDVMVNNLDEALRVLKNAVRKREPASVGLTANPPEIIREMAVRGVVPDLLADLANSEDESSSKMLDGVRALEKLGSILLRATDESPLYDTKGNATVCLVALSGEPTDIQRIDRLFIELCRQDESLTRGLPTKQRRVRYQGLPARAFRLSGEQRSRLATEVNQLVAQHELKAPILVGCLPSLLKTICQPTETNRKTPPDSEPGALLQLSVGAAWASIAREADGHARVVAMAVVADGTNQASAQMERVLTQNASQ